MAVQQDDVRRQYHDDSNLNARSALHERFSTNPYGWHRWVFDHLTTLPVQMCILELGCGPGYLWDANRDRIPAGWDLTLTDFSAGMVDSGSAEAQRPQHPLDDEGRRRPIHPI